jgi:hypothetical protein
MSDNREMVVVPIDGHKTHRHGAAGAVLPGIQCPVPAPTFDAIETRHHEMVSFRAG